MISLENKKDRETHNVTRETERHMMLLRKQKDTEAHDVTCEKERQRDTWCFLCERQRDT